MNGACFSRELNSVFSRIVSIFMWKIPLFVQRFCLAFTLFCWDFSTISWNFRIQLCCYVFPEFSQNFPQNFAFQMHWQTQQEVEILNAGKVASVAQCLKRSVSGAVSCALNQSIIQSISLLLCGSFNAVALRFAPRTLHAFYLCVDVLRAANNKDAGTQAQHMHEGGGGGWGCVCACVCDGFTCKIYIVQMRRAKGNSRWRGRGKAGNVGRG